MELGDLSQLAQNALLLSVVLSLPVVGVAMLVSIIMALFQAATQVQDITIAHLPRFVVVVLTLAALGSWMGSQITSFASLAFAGG